MKYIIFTNTDAGTYTETYNMLMGIDTIIQNIVYTTPADRVRPYVTQ
jgi:hypothetical protein